MNAVRCAISMTFTALSGCWLIDCAMQGAAASSSEVERMKGRIAGIQNIDETGELNLDNFDDLDFNVFSGQKRDDLNRSHAKYINVHWPDGRTTKGIEVHIEDLTAMFVYAPDTRIQEHPIKVASGDYTAVTGVLEGTFTKPVPTGDGKSIPPAGKSFRLTMSAVGVWKDGMMVKECLIWDTETYRKRLGLAK